MRIVIAHSSFNGFGGTETYMLTVAHELGQLGHEVTIAVAGELGPIAAEATAQGIDVVSGIASWPERADCALANDAATAAELAARYPNAPRVMLAHSDYFALQYPPQLSDVCSAIIVLNDRVAGHVESLAAHAPVVRMTQPVDTLRFSPRRPEPTSARRALVLGNYLTGRAADELERACLAAGIRATFVGSHSGQTSRPEFAIAENDLVIGLGRCVVEAMACGRAAYVFGIAGGDGWVTAESYPALEADGFGGLVSADAVNGESLAAELRHWTPQMGTDNRVLAVKNHDALAHARRLVQLFGSLEARPGLSVEQADEHARLVRSEWRAWNRYMAEKAAANDLRARLEQSEQALEQTQETLETITTSRRFKLGSRLAAPLDRLRGR